MHKGVELSSQLHQKTEYLGKKLQSSQFIFWKETVNLNFFNFSLAGRKSNFVYNCHFPPRLSVLLRHPGVNDILVTI